MMAIKCPKCQTENPNESKFCMECATLETLMQKFVFILTVCLVFSFCGTNQPKVDRFIEDGVEVVQNRLVPYVIKGEANFLTLELNYILDLEREDLSELGMSDIIGFDVDSESNHYFLVYLS